MPVTSATSRTLLIIFSLDPGVILTIISVSYSAKRRTTLSDSMWLWTGSLKGCQRQCNMAEKKRMALIAALEMVGGGRGRKGSKWGVRGERVIVGATLN